jgi:hypothetical protein
MQVMVGVFSPPIAATSRFAGSSLTVSSKGTIVALATHHDLMSAVRAGLAYMTVNTAYGLPGMSQSLFCNDLSSTSNKN